MTQTYLCYGCFMSLNGDENVCPYCGYHLHENISSTHILKPGAVLNQKYTIGRKLGEGGFGITYLAWDNNMQTKIAIKEFYPANLVARDTASNSKQIYTVTESHSNEFHTGLERFVKEASILAKFFNLPGIVSVKDFFYENGTAYIVMEYIDGISLKEYLKQKGGRLSLEETLTLMKPVMESLAVVHKQKLLHRDISPDNLMVSSDYQVKLIDFGSARYYDTQSDKSMTVVLKHGYAPVEQYSSNGNQGTWTDVYSLCATMYRMITGKVPEESITRLGNDTLAPIRSYEKKIPKNIEQAIHKGLSVMAKDRQQTVEELYHDMYISRQNLRLEKRTRMYQSINRFLVKLIIILILAIAVFAAAWVKRDSIRELRADIANRLYPVKADESEEASGQRNEPEVEEDSSQKLAADNAEEDSENEKLSDSEKTDQKMESADEAAKDEEEQEPAAEDEVPQGADAGTQSYQLMRSGAESVSQTDTSVIKVKNGRLNNLAADYTVGEILDLYSETEGSWYTYEDESTLQTYVYYEGTRGGEPFVLEFEVYQNDTFKLTGAAQNNVVIERYSDFFQGILDSLGL